MIDCEKNVADCPIFRTMSPEERDAILRLADHVTYATGRSVICEGNNHPHGLFAIRSGSCEVVHSSREFGEQQVAFLRPGAIFGEIAFFDPAPHSATIRVVEQAEFLFFSVENFQKLELLQPLAAHKFVLNMGRILAQKMRQADHMLANHFPTSQLVSDLSANVAE